MGKLSVLLALSTTVPCVPVPPSAAITPELVSTASAAELERRLLGSTRLPIVQAYLWGEALAPPTPPGKPVVTTVALFEQATDSGEEGFCQKVRYMVRLKPVMRERNGQLPPAQAALVTPSTLYRWKTTDGRGPAFEGIDSEFFTVSDMDAQAVFARIRDLADLQKQALEHGQLDLTGTVDDEFGRQGRYAPGETGPVTDWQAALKAFPVSKIRIYDFLNTSTGLIWRFR